MPSANELGTEKGRASRQAERGEWQEKAMIEARKKREEKRKRDKAERGRGVGVDENKSKAV